MSNTKLTKEAKNAGKVLLAVFLANGGAVHANEFSGVTVAVIPAFPGANTVRVSTSVASPDEKKYRPSVGKYTALTNMDTGIYVVMPKPVNLDYFAFDLSEFAGGN